MENVKFLFSQDDIEMKDDLERTFGDSLQYSEEFDYIGDIIAIYVIPATALAIQIIDFTLTHLVVKDYGTKNKSENEKEDVREKRKVEVDGQRISLVGYSADEIVKILSSLGLGHNNVE